MSTNGSKLDKLNLGELRRKLSERSGPSYWKSLNELAETEEFQDYLRHEFPAHVDTWTDPVGRRRFLQLMGASLALAGFTACTRQPEERLVPYVNAPEDIIPGKPLYFASTLANFGYGQGVVVESHDGRPTKIEGNEQHPASLGATSVHAQASVLDLYDPDRLDVIRSGGRLRTWELFTAEMLSRIEQYRLNGGQGLHILSGNVTSPTLSAQFAELRSRFPEARWHQWEPVNRDNSRRGSQIAFGEVLNSYHRLDRATKILSLDADFLFWGPDALRNTKDFVKRRRVDDSSSEMNRLYVVESSPGVTGTMADHRLAVTGSLIPEIARSLATELGIDAGRGASLSDPVQEWISVVAQDLRAGREESVVVAGESQPPEVHALTHLINQELGSLGNVVILTDAAEAEPVIHQESIRELVDTMNAGEVETLILLGGNPAHDAPADLGFAGALSQVPLRVHLTSYQNETSRLCNWQIPESHPLESWSDLRAFDGTASLVQPLIEPIYQSRNSHQLLALILEGSTDAGDYDLVRSYWRTRSTEGDFEKWWRRCLHDGLVPGTEADEISRSVDRQSVLQSWSGRTAAGERSEERLEVHFRPDPHIWDGRYLNNAWLQEAPKPLTKLTWDNAALLSPSDAERLELSAGQVIELRTGNRMVRAPVWIQPGHPEGGVTLHLGYGRSRPGRVGEGAGFNAYALRTSDSPWHLPEVEITAVGETVSLVSTQDHYSMEDRHLVREAGLETFLENPDFAQELSHDPTKESELYPGFEYDGHSWGMTVDLNACIGCNACVLACQAENNIAVVGRDEVANGREMHWIRIDRYYSGSLDDPEVLHQPVMCQHCENAPCESVCPVAATVHSDEGLNDMVYNRCVGTRYCSNNCPYKVRRFNYFLYSDWQTESLKLQRNPDVTVRSRGVMEKCTYCVQRINAAKIDAKLDERELQDGEIKTACQQVCPADAIVFGDLNDADSQVARLKQSQRNYGILTELRTVPRTTYLARIRNRNPRLGGDEETHH